MSLSHQRVDVLFVIPTLEGGGAERVTLTLLRHFDRTLFRISLAVLSMEGARFREDLPPDIELIDLGTRRVRHAIPRLVRMIWRRKPDVVFTTLGQLNIAIAALRWLLPNRTRYLAREVTVVSQLRVSYSVPRWWFWLYRRFYGGLDTIVCQSQAMRDDLVENFRVRPEKIVVIHNPLDLMHIRRLSGVCAQTPPHVPADRLLRLVGAGSLTHVKGFDILIEALGECRDRPFSLVLLGDGPLRAQLEDLVAKKGLSASVRFAGFVKNPYAYFAQADALVLSSRFEGFPNVALESMACGTPVIAIPCPGGVREMLRDVRECVIAENCSPSALARAITDFSPGARVPADALEPYAVATIVRRYEQCILGTQVR